MMPQTHRKPSGESKGATLGKDSDRRQDAGNAMLALPIPGPVRGVCVLWPRSMPPRVRESMGLQIFFWRTNDGCER
jgi:hypothetical protein